MLGVEESKSDDAGDSAALGIAGGFGRRGRSSRGLSTQSSPLLSGAPPSSSASTCASSSSLLQRLLDTFTATIGSAPAALRASAALVLTRMQAEVADLAVPSLGAAQSLVNPVNRATRCTAIAADVAWNYNVAPDCLAFMVPGYIVRLCRGRRCCRYRFYATVLFSLLLWL